MFIGIVDANDEFLVVGLAAGLTAAGFGIGSALTIIPIQAMISTHGYQNTFFTFGIGQSLVVVLLSLLLFAPQHGETASLLVPLTNVLVAETGGWKGAFIIAALFNVIAALLTIFVLKPMRQRLVTRPEGRATWVVGAKLT